MKLSFDLHVHSEASPDGWMTTEEIAAAARAQGLDGVAVCDHDHVYQGPTECSGILLLPGVELSTQYGHLLGLFVRQPIRETDFFKAAEAIHAQGGLAVMAHPFARTSDPERLIPLVSWLDGMEVWNGRANRRNPRANDLAAAFVKEYSLLPSAGGDAHVAQEVGNGVLTLEVRERSLEAVYQALRQGRGTVSGRQGKSWYAAKSQYHKLRKTGASPVRWLKWLAFAGKCTWQDVRTYGLHTGKGEEGPACHSLSKPGKRENKF